MGKKASYRTAKEKRISVVEVEHLTIKPGASSEEVYEVLGNMNATFIYKGPALVLDFERKPFDN